MTHASIVVDTRNLKNLCKCAPCTHTHLRTFINLFHYNFRLVLPPLPLYVSGKSSFCGCCCCVNMHFICKVVVNKCIYNKPLTAHNSNRYSNCTLNFYDLLVGFFLSHLAMHICSFTETKRSEKKNVYRVWSHVPLKLLLLCAPLHLRYYMSDWMSAERPNQFAVYAWMRML